MLYLSIERRINFTLEDMVQLLARSSLCLTLAPGADCEAIRSLLQARTLCRHTPAPLGPAAWHAATT